MKPTAILCTRDGKQPADSDLAVVRRMAHFLRESGPAPDRQSTPPGFPVRPLWEFRSPAHAYRVRFAAWLLSQDGDWPGVGILPRERPES